MRGLLLLVAARAAEASSEAAVLLVGAAYDVDEARLRATKKFVVDAFGASETLVLLKGVHYNKNIYTEAEVRALRDVVAATLRPSFLDIRPGAELTSIYARNASRIGKCIWSRETSCLYRHSSSRNPLEVRIEAWWGVLQAAHGALTKRESIRGKAFDRVACVRADIEFTSPIRHSTKLEPRYVYAASDPPDAVFLFGSRSSAERVLTTYARVDALARDGKCAALDRARFMYSWFLPCYAVKELYGQGVRIVADPQIHGKIRPTRAAARRAFTSWRRTRPSPPRGSWTAAALRRVDPRAAGRRLLFGVKVPRVQPALEARLLRALALRSFSLSCCHAKISGLLPRRRTLVPAIRRRCRLSHSDDPRLASSPERADSSQASRRRRARARSF